MQFGWIGIAVSMFWLMAWPLAADAQASPQASAGDAKSTEAPPGYERLVQRGVREMDLHNYLEARSLFLEAHKLAPSARTLRALGMVEFELRNYVDALGYLDQALHSWVRPLDSDKREQVVKLRDEAKDFVARCTFKVRPAGAAIELDGTPVTLDIDGRLLQVGEHTLQVSAPGYHTVRRVFQVAGGDAQEFAITLVPEAKQTANDQFRPTPIQAGTPRDQPAAGSSSPLHKRWWLWTVVGAVVIGAAAGVAIAAAPDQRERQALYGGSAMSVLKGPP